MWLEREDALVGGGVHVELTCIAAALEVAYTC